MKNCSKALVIIIIKTGQVRDQVREVENQVRRRKSVREDIVFNNCNKHKREKRRSKEREKGSHESRRKREIMYRRGRERGRELIFI